MCRHDECGKQSTLPEESKREERKGQSSRELSERLDVGRPEMFGGFSSGHFWIDGLRLRAATKASQRGKGRAAPERGSSIAQLLSTEGGDTGGS